MIYCPICGAQTEVGKFCNVCGQDMLIVKNIAEASPQTMKKPLPDPSSEVNRHNDYHQRGTPQEITHKQKNKKSPVVKGVKGVNKNVIKPIGIVLITLIIIGLVGGVFFLLYSETIEIDEQRNYEYTPETAIDSLELTIDLSSQNVIVSYNSTPMSQAFIINATFEATIKTLGEKTFDQIYTINADFDDYRCYFGISFNGVIFSTSSNSKVEVILNSEIDYNLKLQVDAGNVDLNVSEGVLLEELFVEVDAGKIYMILDRCSLTGSVDIEVDAGDTTIEITNITLLNDIEWYFNVDAGELDVSITQEIALGGEIDSYWETDAGDQNYVVNLNHNVVGSTWECELDAGDIDMGYPLSEYSRIGDSLEYDLYSQGSGFDIYSDVNAGDIDITITEL